MKKKFASVLALAMAMTLTMGMTVCADESPVTSAGNTVVVAPITTTIVEPTGDEKAALDQEVSNTDANLDVTLPAGASAGKVTAGEMKSAKETASVVAAKAVTAGKTVKSTTVVGSKEIKFEGEVPAEGVVVGLTIPKIDAAKKYIILHYNKTKTAWETMGAEKVEGNTFFVRFTSFSPVVVVEVEEEAAAADTNTNNTTTTTTTTPAQSPKTGETLPVAGIMAVICLAGAVVCAKRARA